MVGKRLADVRNDNQQKARDIQRAKMFNKKEDDRKKKRTELKDLNDDIRDYNKDLEGLDIKLDVERRKLEDKQLLKKQAELVLQLKQDFNKVSIDISIAQSRIKDLEGMRQMTLNQLRDIVADKQLMEKENNGLQQRIEGKGLSEQEQKVKQFEAEREQFKKIKNSFDNQTQVTDNLMKQLALEEKNARAMLDEKIKLQQMFQQDTQDLNEQKAFATKCREEIIKLQIRLSQLLTHEERMREELHKLTTENDFYIKKNKDLEIENAQLSKEIQLTVQKIDINSLLKEIDIEDMRLLATNNKQMNSALHNLIGKWESIQRQEAAI